MLDELDVLGLAKRAEQVGLDGWVVWRATG